MTPQELSALIEAQLPFIHMKVEVLCRKHGVECDDVEDFKSEAVKMCLVGVDKFDPSIADIRAFLNGCISASFYRYIAKLKSKGFTGLRDKRDVLNGLGDRLETTFQIYGDDSDLLDELIASELRERIIASFTDEVSKETARMILAGYKPSIRVIADKFQLTKSSAFSVLRKVKHFIFYHLSNNQ
jgi:hypothetical protein